MAFTADSHWFYTVAPHNIVLHGERASWIWLTVDICLVLHTFTCVTIVVAAHKCGGAAQAKRNILMESAFPNFSTEHAALPAP